MLIRPAVIEDIPAILTIEQQTEAAAHWTDEKYREIFEKQNPRRFAIVAEGKSGVQGFGVIVLLEQGCEVENLVVIRHRRRRGLGKRLLRSLIDLAENEGASGIFLEVREGNAGARGLYNTLGFAESGRRKGYYHNPEEDAILYRL